MELPKRIKRTEKLAEKVITRLFTAWIITSLIFLAINPKPFIDLEFFGNTDIFLFLTLTAMFLIFLCLIKSEKIVAAVMVISTFLYFFRGIYLYNDFYFALGCCAVILGVVYYAKIGEIRLEISKTSLWVGIGVLMLLFTVLMSIACCLRYKNYWTPCYDFGIFSQMFYYMKETGMALTTCERDGLLSHFAVHFSPMFYTILPIYELFPSPMTLMVIQCLLPAVGVIPLIKICRAHKLSNLASLGFGACYLLYPAIAGSCNYYIHENNFLPPLILFLIYFMEREKTVSALIFGILTLLTKEDSPVYVAVIALYFIFANKNYKRSLTLLFISLIYFATVTHFLSVYGDGVMTGRYENYIYEEGGSLFTMVKAVVQNPLYALQQSITADKIKYILQMLAPMLFLPLHIKRPCRLILLIPFILINLMTNYRYQYDIMFQYGFGSGSLLIYSALLNFSEMKRGREKMLLSALLCSAFIFCGLFGNWLNYYPNYRSSADSRQAIDHAARLIPDDAAVVASTFILPNLSQRKEIYELETTEKKGEYYILDLRFSHNEYELSDFMTSEYEQVYLKENVVAIFKRK